MSDTTKKIHAAIYLRVSTADQIDNTSIAEQRRTCIVEIERRGWTFAGEYLDAGLSGTRADRPDWQRMLADAKAHKFDALVVLNISRFSRISHHAIEQSQHLLELGVSLVSIQENFDLTTPAGRAMFGMSAIFAQLDREQIVAKTVAGQRAKGRAGLWPGGQPPFGWRLEGTKRDARPMPDLREREVIALAYELLVKKHLSCGKVADRLNDLGMPPRKTPRWNPDVLRRTLANPTLHTAKVIWGSPESGSIYKRSHHTKLDKSGKPVYGDPIELILPEPPLTAAQHQGVMRALGRRSTRGQATAPTTQLLSTRVVGGCGKHYIGVTISNKDYNVYRCSGRKHLNGSNKCTCKQIQAQAIDARVWAEVVALLGDLPRLEMMARLWLEVPEQADNSMDEKVISGIESQIAKLERGRLNAARELLLADNPEPVREALAAIESELIELQNRRAAYAALQRSATDKAEKLTDLVRLAERATGRLRNMAPELRREVVEILDLRVTIGEVTNSEPETVQISGKIDPRLFGDGTNTSAESVSPLPSSPVTGNQRHEDDGSGGFRRASGRDHAEQ